MEDLKLELEFQKQKLEILQIEGTQEKWMVPTENEIARLTALIKSQETEVSH
jgi:hypothetical protein